MTIGRKILAGCIALTLLTALMGAYAREAQHRLGAVTIRLYDDAFQAMSYLRSAQNELVRAEAELRKNLSGGQGLDEVDPLKSFDAAAREIAENVQVARDRGMSEQARVSAERLIEMVMMLAENAQKRDWPNLLDVLDSASSAFDTAVEIYAADGYRFRKDADRLIERAALETWIATALAVLVALTITVWLSRSIVPVLGKAVGVAKAIAAGRLDNVIEAGGRDETAQLLSALNVMQASIAAGLARVHALMDEQASSHAGQISRQHARFDAALSNMSQGLCLFGADGRLSVANVRFAAMFGIPETGATPAEVFAGAGMVRLLGSQAKAEASFSCELPDGRAIAVTRSPISGGGWVSTFEDVTEQRRDAAKLAHMAHYDALTGLPNRVLFREHLHLALTRARRGQGLAILCLDLDRFKPVNDALGHPVGDALLCAVSERLRRCVRETDLIARLGGDEFAIVQEHAQQPVDAGALARRLVESVAQPFDIDGHRIVIGTSVGIALASDSLTGADALLKCADLALYRAKADGRGAWAFFEADMDARMQARRLMELDLRGALAAKQFEVFYQPLVSTAHGEITGFEALVRWRHPKRGMVSPAEFIPLAEEIGIVSDIGAWVLRQACTDIASWSRHLKIAVNLSPVQFRDKALAQGVARILSETGMDPKRLELEVTESLLLGNDDSVLAILHDLRAMGVRIAMDDFGTGYSSLSYLRRFPFDKIKIDQSFVREMGAEEDCIAIIRAVVGLGRSLGMAVNAEGVETPQQFASLCAEGCGEVQGYLFSKPKPASDIPALLAAHRGDRDNLDGVGQHDEAEARLVVAPPILTAALA